MQHLFASPLGQLTLEKATLIGAAKCHALSVTDSQTNVRRTHLTVACNFLKLGSPVAVLPTGYDWSQMLAYYVQRQFERQLFIPPTGFNSVNGPTPDYTFLCSLACQAI